MNTKKQTSKEYFKTLQIIYYALVAGQLIFVSIGFYMVKTGRFNINNPSLNNVFIYIIPLIVIGGVLLSNFIFNKKLNDAKGKPSLIEKMTTYRTCLIIRYGLLEGPSFLAVIAYLVTNSIIFLGLAGLIIVLFSTFKPTI